MAILTSKCFALIGTILILTAPTFATLPEDVTTWSVEQVVEWAATSATNIKDPQEFQKYVQQHSITGNILLLVDETDLDHEFNIKSSLIKFINLEKRIM